MLEYVSKDENPKEVVRIAVCQLYLREDQMQNPFASVASAADTKVEKKLKSLFRELEQYNVDAVVLPECSTPAHMLDELIEWSHKHRAIVIAGSHYADRGDGKCSVSPVIFPDRTVYYSEKQIVSPLEKSIFTKDSIVAGDTVYLFQNTTIGTFCVPICSDFLDDEYRAEFFYNDLDFVFVVACQRESSKYYALFAHHCMNSESGVYCAYSNLKVGLFGDGKSAFFGVVDKSYLGTAVARGLTDLAPEQKLWVASSANDYLIVDVDRVRKKPPRTKSVGDEPNVRIEATRSLIKSRRRDKDKTRNYKLVAFDLDGTIIRGLKYSWSELWEFCGDHQGKRWKLLLRSYMEGKTTYDAWCREAVEFYRKAGLTREMIEELARTNLSVTTGLREGISELRSMGFKLAIVSGGIDVFLRTAVPDHANLFDRVFINRLSFDVDGVIANVDPTKHDFEGKLLALEELCEEFDIDMEDVIFVGDDHNDQSALLGAGHSIVYSANRSHVAITAHHAIHDDDFCSLVAYIKSITGGDP